MRSFRSLLLAVALVASGLAFSGVSSQVCAQEVRTWTSSNGKHTFEAKVISFDDGILKLKGKNGKVKELDPKQLSNDDRKYLSELGFKGDDDDAKVTKEQKERLKNLGLKVSSDEFSFIEERKLKSEVSKSLKAKKKLIGMSMKLQAVRFNQLNAQRRIVVLKQKNVQLNSALANAGNAVKHNQLIGAIKANQSAMELLQKTIDDLGKQLKEGQSFINKSRDQFVENILNVRKLSDSFDERAESMCRISKNRSDAK